MAYDRYLIAPVNTGLETDASFGYDEYLTKGCVMTENRKRRNDIIDMRGQKIGMLTVIDIHERHPRVRGASWLCLCECGNNCIRTTSHLREGRNKSCGCLRERTIENTGINILMGMYTRRAWKNHHVFNLSREVFYKLIKGKCFYCGTEPRQVLKRNKTNLVQIVYNGIDRIDSTKAYNPSNCVSCCKYCNFGKSDLTVDEFKAHIKRICSWLMINT